MPSFGVSTTQAPRTGFGTVPGPIGIPPNVFSQLSGAVPNFTGNLAGAGSVIQSQLAGDVSPSTMNALKTGAAEFGVASGMPGSGLEENQLFGNIAGFSEGQQQKGLQNLLAQIGALGPTQTNPNLAAEISARNADYAAAPDPKLAAQEQFNQWLKGAGAAAGLANPARGPWWAPQGVSSPPVGATIGRSYAGAGGNFNPFGSPDAFGYNYSNPEAGTTGVYGATNPSTYTASGSALPPNYYSPLDEEQVPTAPGIDPYG
jgi:hypothetical protein